MSEERTVEVEYYKNGNKIREIPYLNGERRGLARWWYDNGFIANFEFWHKDILVFELKFEENEKISAPKPNQPILNANQFLELCKQR